MFRHALIYILDTLVACFISLANIVENPSLIRSPSLIALLAACSYVAGANTDLSRPRGGARSRILRNQPLALAYSLGGITVTGSER